MGDIVVDGVVKGLAQWGLLLSAGFLVYRIAKLPDFSLAASALLGGIVCAKCVLLGLSVPWALCAAMISGVCVGGSVAYLVYRFRVNGIVVGIAVAFAVYVPALVIINDFSLPGEPTVQLSIVDRALSGVDNILYRSKAGIIVFVFVPIMALLLLVSRTSCAARIRVACDIGPMAKTAGLSWGVSAGAVTVVGHAIGALGGGTVLVNEGAVDVNRFRDVMLWIFAGLVLGEVGWLLVFHWILRGRVGRAIKRIDRRLPFCRMQHGIAAITIGGASLGVITQAVLGSPLRSYSNFSIGVVLLVLIFLLTSTKLYKTPQARWDFYT